MGPDSGSISSGSITFTNNYTDTPVLIGAFAGGGTITGNTMAGGSPTTGNNITIEQDAGAPATTLYTISGNKYYRRREGTKNTLKFGATNYCYNASHTGTGCSGTRWQELVGAGSVNFDIDGSYLNNGDTSVGYHESTNASTPMPPAADAVFLRANAFDANRANIIAWNWDGNGDVSVNVSGFLSSGDIYTVVFAGNPWGSPIISGQLYTSGNITIPMTIVPMAQRVGYWVKSFNPLPDFGVFVILKK
jgi:hypothetical protein